MLWRRALLNVSDPVTCETSSLPLAGLQGELLLLASEAAGLQHQLECAPVLAEVMVSHAADAEASETQLPGAAPPPRRPSPRGVAPASHGLPASTALAAPSSRTAASPFVTLAVVVVPGEAVQTRGGADMEWFCR